MGQCEGDAIPGPGRRARPADRVVPQRRDPPRSARRVRRLPGRRTARRATCRSCRGTMSRSSAGCCCAGDAPTAARPIRARYPLVELLTGVAVRRRGVAARSSTSAAAMPALLVFTALGVALAAIDLDVRRLPNLLVLPAYPRAGGPAGRRGVVQAGLGVAGPRRSRRTRAVPLLLRARDHPPAGHGLRRRQARRASSAWCSATCRGRPCSSAPSPRSSSARWWDRRIAVGAAGPQDRPALRPVHGRRRPARAVDRDPGGRAPQV